MFRHIFQFVLLFLVDVSVGGTLATQAVCPSVGLPANGSRQGNVIYKTKPMFVLDARSVKDGYLPGTTYSLYVKAQDRDRKFSDVMVWAEGSGQEGCKTGSFDTNPEFYHQPENCPHLVTRNSKEPEHRFHFSWTAPPCGCVTIRTRVTTVESGSYVLDDNSLKDGYLSSYICPKDLQPLLTKIPLEERENLLCRVVTNVTGPNLATRRHLLSRRKIEYNTMSPLQRDAWEQALGQRAYNIRKCCGLKGVERTECLGDDRRRRIDRFCGFGESMIPYTAKRRQFMEQRREDCCWRLGERRYHCFSHIPTDEAFSKDSVWNIKHVQEMDESDPLNDLEDYNEEVLREFSNNPSMVKVNAEKAAGDDSPWEPSEKEISSTSKEIKTTEEYTEPTTIPVVKTTTTPTTTTTKPTTTTTTKEMSVTTTETEIGKKTTLTSEDLQRRMRKIRLRLDCCESGREEGERAGDNPWGTCTSGAFKYTRKMRKARRKCRTYFLKCCIEEAESDEEIEIDEDDEDEEDDKSENDNPKVERKVKRKETKNDNDEDFDDDKTDSKKFRKQRKSVRSGNRDRKDRKRGRRKRRRG